MSDVPPPPVVTSRRSWRAARKGSGGGGGGRIGRRGTPLLGGAVVAAVAGLTAGLLLLAGLRGLGGQWGGGVDNNLAVEGCRRSWWRWGR